MNVLHSQGKTVAHKVKGAGKNTPPDIQAQAEEGALDRPKSSGEDFGVMSARADSWTALAHPNRYNLLSGTTLMLLVCSCTDAGPAVFSCPLATYSGEDGLEHAWLIGGS